LSKRLAKRHDLNGKLNQGLQTKKRKKKRSAACEKGRHSCGYYQGPGYVKEILKLYHRYLGQKEQETVGTAASHKDSKQKEVS
jgi:hypothetical protein